ncbi:MAG: ImmA/IrrE family metallo-endopeptidase [Eubacteriales bacterium]
MYYYHTNDEIDEIGEGLIRKYNYQAFIQGASTDIQGFITDHLKYRIVADRLADKDAGRMAFLADGKSTVWVWRDGKRVEVIPPEGMIIIDEFLCQEKNSTRRRFVLAHEAGHIIMDLLNNKPVTAAYNNEFDSEQEYSFKDFVEMFNINENKATSMGVALLMPKTLVINCVRTMIAPHKRIPLYGNSVFCDSDRAIINQVAEHFQVSYKSMFYRLRDLKMFEPRDIDEYIAKSLGNMGGGI